jgi:hypothetical protein
MIGVKILKHDTLSDYLRDRKLNYVLFGTDKQDIVETIMSLAGFGNSDYVFFTPTLSINSDTGIIVREVKI